MKTASSITAQSAPGHSAQSAPGTQRPAPVAPRNRGGGEPLHRAFVHAEPTACERDAAFAAFFGAMNRMTAEHRAAAEAAKPALDRLCAAMRQRTGQGGTLRALLWSLYNGQSAPLIEIVGLDWELRKDLCAVLLGFGFEDRRDAARHFFYDAMKAAIVKSGQWEWFTEAEEKAEVAA